jgi:hypothetical protein
VYIVSLIHGCINNEQTTVTQNVVTISENNSRESKQRLTSFPATRQSDSRLDCGFWTEDRQIGKWRRTNTCVSIFKY